MVSVHEFQDQVQGPDQSTSSKPDRGDDVTAPAVQPSWGRRHFFFVFLTGSLIFHLGAVAIVAFFDFREQTSWTSFRELPVELINEEQVQKEEKKTGPAVAKEQSPEIQTRPSEAPIGKSAQPPQEQTTPAGKPSENKQSENKPAESKLAETKPAENNETKLAENKAAWSKPEEKKTERNIASQRQPQNAANKQQEVQQKEFQQKEPAKQSVQKPPVPETPKSAEAERSTSAPAQPAQDQHPPAPQQQQPAPSTSQQPPQAAQSSPAPSSRMPTFLYQPSDRLSLAIPAPLPTNDADAEPISYKVIVFGMLERAKDYPESARERRATGHVVIAFSIDDTGQPQNISMIESSGENDLDAEALAMISRAAPFPVPPVGAQREFAVNIGFGGE